MCVYALLRALCGLLLPADALDLRCRSVNGGGGLFEGFGRVEKGCVFSCYWFRFVLVNGIEGVCV